MSADQGKAFTKYGELDEKTEINQDDPESTTGRWKGIGWKREIGRPDTGGMRITLNLGKRTDFGDGIIYYEQKIYTDDVKDDFYFVLLLSPQN